MSVNKLGIITFSSFLIFATAPFGFAQQENLNTTKKQTTTQQGTTTKEAGKTGSKKSTTTKKTSGVSREKARQIQTALKKEGFDPGPVDGIMGPMTMTALRNYQSHMGLEVTGNLNAETENSLTGKTAGNRRSSLEKPGPVISDMSDVRQVQQQLTDLMYNPGDINGMMTSQTRQAIREFQWLNNLPVTGNLDEPTKIAINTQGQGDVQSAQLGQTYSSDINREKHADRASKDREKDGSHRIAKATEVLEDLTAAPDKKIPHELLERADAIAVFPNVVKGAFGIGGRYGKGVVSQRLDNGRWSSPAFVKVGGGSFGAQIGISSTDLVLVFTDKKALDLLEKGKDLKLGVDAGIVAGPVGRTAEAGVNANLKSAIYAYSRSKGLYAGIALDGAVLDIDDSMNAKVYGSSVTAKDILDGRTAANNTVRPFLNALEKVMPKSRISQK